MTAESRPGRIVGMETRSSFAKNLRRAAAPALALIAMAFFGGYAVMGANGVLAYGDYKRQLVKQEALFARLDKQRAVIKNRVALLDPDKANPDMVDEVTRQKLNVVHPDELVMPQR